MDRPDITDRGPEEEAEATDERLKVVDELFGPAWPDYRRGDKRKDTYDVAKPPALPAEIDDATLGGGIADDRGEPAPDIISYN